MKIAVTYDILTGEIFQHFGKTPAFKLYDVDTEAKKILNTTVVPTGDYSHGALAGFLKELNVDTLISGGIGLGAKMKLDENGIRLFGGAKGRADDAVCDFLEGTLEFDPLAAEHHGPCHHQ